MRRHRFVAVLLCAFSAALADRVSAQRPQPTTEPAVITTGQTITPVGVQAVFNGVPRGLTFGKSSDEVWAVVGELGGAQLYGLSATENKILHRVAPTADPGMQSLVFDKASGTFLLGGTSVVGGAGKRVKIVRLVQADGTASPTAIGEALGHNQVGAIAVAQQTDTSGARFAVIPLTYNNQLAVVDVTSGSLRGTVSTGIAPFGAAIDGAGTVAYVSNWGGRRAKAGDRTMTSGNPVDADLTDKWEPDPVVVDRRGIASTGSITRVDLRTMQVTDTIDVGLHPTAVAWDVSHQRLYVANSNSDSVSIVDTTTQQVMRTLAIRPFREQPPGLAPTALALDTRHDRLYVACGGINAVVVVDTSHNTVVGLIPTAWYPSSLALSQDGRRLAVGALLGIGAGWQIYPAIARNLSGDYRTSVRIPDLTRRYVHAVRGAVTIIDIPETAQLGAYTVAVAHNNRLTLTSASAREDVAPRPGAAPVPIPERVGERSLIDHVVYIIKENRTYDQFFGDLGKGNGDPSLVLYGEDVAPNHRRLATQFVLLDNFYATGGNSGDGHQWVTQANETEYTLWPGYAGRSYPWGGDDPIAVARGGFIWDEALEKQLTVQIFGEYVGYGYPANPTPKQIEELRAAKLAAGGEELQRLVAAWRAGEDFSGRYYNVAPNEALNAIMAHDYPAWGVEAIPDVVRAQVFQGYVKRWERDGKMPNLVIMHLPRDHTEGTVPGKTTPRASVADNDWALGQIVDALSHTSFWRRMAIFVVEDDAQGGVDHVDGHRTIALAISPYTKRGAIDSTFYAHQSMLKTIELILGLKPLSIFDLTATSMSASFQTEADATPYTAVEPRQAIDELNAPLSSLQAAARRGAIESMQMHFDVVDAAPSDRLNRILWHDARGWNTPYPRTRAAVFSPFSLDVDDADRRDTH